ncbi:MAG: uncharacterized protein A8A55_1587 [Amphiamblys sp. WSBS2006]|nr:MAG: uncharacterized protein A8A55_1587 [Amphiamblys sp. WSBS2006]
MQNSLELTEEEAGNLIKGILSFYSKDKNNEEYKKVKEEVFRMVNELTGLRNTDTIEESFKDDVRRSLLNIQEDTNNLLAKVCSCRREYPKQLMLDYENAVRQKTHPRDSLHQRRPHTDGEEPAQLGQTPFASGGLEKSIAAVAEKLGRANDLIESEFQ